jgi:hypothetical protein
MLPAPHLLASSPGLIAEAQRREIIEADILYFLPVLHSIPASLPDWRHRGPQPARHAAD